MKHYDQASLEAQFLIDNFPRSEYVEEAYIIKARSIAAILPASKRDQTRTEELIKHLERFIETYPKSEYLSEARKILYQGRVRIAEKELRNGLFYKRRGDLDAAVIYFRTVINRFPETPAAREARYNLAQIRERQLRLDDARKHYLQLADSLDEWGRRAKERLTEIEK
jgi:outer membrane protein assembly factor BamD